MYCQRGGHSPNICRSTPGGAPTLVKPAGQPEVDKETKEELNLSNPGKDPQHPAIEPGGNKETRVSKIKYLLISPPDMRKKEN